ncbi:MAG: hypothetical protein LBG93_05720, partial [Treponema sp.]|nr:hypothetical protein [Treponema sp.]
MAENTMNNIPLQDHLKALMDEVSAKLREVAESQKDTDRRMKETDRQMKQFSMEAAENRKETDRQMKELSRETAEQMKQFSMEAAENRKETEKQIQEAAKVVRRNGKQMGDLHRRFGELAEHLVAPNIHKRFNELGYHFGSCSPGGMKIFDKQGNTKTEIDLVMENGNTIMALEVKTKPTVKDVGHHIKRLEIPRDARRGLNDKRVIKGAIAGAIFGAAEKKATMEAGLYVVEQSG